MKVEKQRICSRFIEPEKLADLRTKRDIEIMNGRLWARELPPPPVLPPFGPLEKISGRLETFSKEFFWEYFNVKAYRTSTLPNLTVGQRGAVAAAAIVAGNPGVGAAIMAKSQASNDTAEYIQGTINGKPFRGWVGITRLQVGDEVDMIVEWQHDHYEAYAIALPKERIVSVCPICDMGHYAHFIYRLKNMFILTMILTIMFAIICLIKEVIKNHGLNVVGVQSYGFPLFIFLCGSFVVSGLIAFSAFKVCKPTRCKLAEEIFVMLDMKNACKINLRKITKQRERCIHDQGQWHDPGDEKNSACPSSKFIYSEESWFYY